MASIHSGWRPGRSADWWTGRRVQDVQELANFFERTVSAYQTGVSGDVAFDEDF
jgi:hypothetical protein